MLLEHRCHASTAGCNHGDVAKSLTFAAMTIRIFIRSVSFRCAFVIFAKMKLRGENYVSRFIANRANIGYIVPKAVCCPRSRVGLVCDHARSWEVLMRHFMALWFLLCPTVLWGRKRRTALFPCSTARTSKAGRSANPGRATRINGSSKRRPGHRQAWVRLDRHQEDVRRFHPQGRMEGSSRGATAAFSCACPT